MNAENQIQLPQDVITIMKIIKEYGAESYVVGGCVRDSLLGRNPKDWDICSPVLPSELMPLFHEKGYRTIETGIQHGTFTVIIDNTMNKYKAPQVFDEDIPLLDIFTLREDAPGTINFEQRLRVLKLIREYKEQVIELWKQDPDPEVNRMEIQMSYLQTMINEVNQLTLNERTIYALIQSLDKSTYQGIRSYALTLLFNMKNRAAYNLIKHSAESVAYLQEDPEGDYQLYDLKFTRNGEKNNEQ